VQHDGRSMPLDTVARETVKKVTGQRAFHGEDQIVTLARWLDDVKAAAEEPVIKVGDADLAVAIGLSGATHASFSQLANNPAAGRLFAEVQQLAQRERKPRGVLVDAEKLLDRAMEFQKVLSGDLVYVYPVTSDFRAKWGAPRPLSVNALIDLSNGPRLAGWPSAEAMNREILYNQARSSRTAWVILAASLVLAIVAGRAKRRAVDVVALLALVGGFAVMTWGIGMRWAVAGRIPAANMYESLLFLAWGVGLFAVVAFAFIRNRVLVMNAAAGATLTMLLVDLLPMDGFIHPIAPVLAGTPWLAIHVPIIMVSYSVLALGVIIAHAQVAMTAFGKRGNEESVERMADLNYWYMFVGSILLIVGIMTGSMWAAESWGRYWGWDPKEVWSLVAWLAYMAILHGRLDRMIGSFGVAVASIVAFQTILMTYLGVNYVLGTGMHSYGFGDSPVLKWMVIVALVEAAFLGWAFIAYRRRALASEAHADAALSA
jgi:cytochrome c-type biogenesis protein CcsB